MKTMTQLAELCGVLRNGMERRAQPQCPEPHRGIAPRGEGSPGRI